LEKKFREALEVKIIKVQKEQELLSKPVEERMALLEESLKPHDKRLRDLESIVFKSNATHRKLLF
jgi:hypothetical protein